MAVTITVPYEKTFSSPKSLEETLEYLSDFEKSIPECFPGLANFEKVSDGRFAWQFQKFGHSNYEFEIRLLTDCKVVSKTEIQITSVKEPGLAEFDGAWELASGFEGAQVQFEGKFTLELPIPFFLKAVAVPFAEKELTKFFDKYIHRVEKNLAK